MVLLNKEQNKPPKLKPRFKTKSGDLSTTSLTNNCENKLSKNKLLISGVKSNPKINIDQRLHLNKRSISTKNLKSKHFNSGSNLKLSSVQQNKIPTYKLDGMKIITNRLNHKLRSYFEAIVKYANRINSKHIDRESVSKRVVRQSFSSLK